MHEQVDDQGICRERVEREHRELPRREAKDAEQEYDEAGEQCDLPTVVHVIDDIHEDRDRRHDLEAREAGIREAKVEPPNE